MNNFLKGFEKITAKDHVLSPKLCGVYFENGCAVATDRRKLVKVDLRLYTFGNDSVNDLDGYFLDNNQLKLIKPKKDEKLIICNGFVSILDSSGDVVRDIEFSKVDKWINYESVMPISTEPIKSIGMNGQFLADVQDVYTKSGQGVPGSSLKISFAGDKKPILITDADGLFTAIVMPIIISH